MNTDWPEEVTRWVTPNGGTMTMEGKLTPEQMQAYFDLVNYDPGWAAEILLEMQEIPWQQALDRLELV